MEKLDRLNNVDNLASLTHTHKSITVYIIIPDGHILSCNYFLSIQQHFSSPFPRIPPGLIRKIYSKPCCWGGIWIILLSLDWSNKSCSGLCRKTLIPSNKVWQWHSGKHLGPWFNIPSSAITLRVSALREAMLWILPPTSHIYHTVNNSFSHTHQLPPTVNYHGGNSLSPDTLLSWCGKNPNQQQNSMWSDGNVETPYTQHSGLGLNLELELQDRDANNHATLPPQVTWLLSPHVDNGAHSNFILNSLRCVLALTSRENL